MRKVRYQPYAPRPERRRPPDDGLWKLLGCVFISAGLLLLFLCIPGWAWAALAGVVLVIGGAVLIRLADRR